MMIFERRSCRADGPRAFRGRSGIAAPLVLLLLVAWPGAAQDAPQRRFLLIYSGHSTLAANTAATQGVAAAFDRELAAGYEIYAEYRDDQRFPGAEANRAFAEEMVRKYRGQQFDAILTFGRAALDYAVANRAELGLDAPVVFGGVTDASLDGADLPADAHGVRSVYSLAGTLDLARRLQPQAKRAVILTGSGPFDRSWDERARRDLAGVEGLAVEHLSGLTIKGFQEAAAQLDRDDILIILTVYKDAAGRNFTPLNAAEMIASRSAAPSWSVYDTFVGRGVVGGEVQRFRGVGEAMARQALRLVDGEPHVEPMREAPVGPVVDWRQMRRFGLDPELLPPGTVLEFHDLSAWERYRAQILLACLVVLAQSATIAALVVQNRRRRRAEVVAAARQVELAHMSRVAQLGELSGALAHELNQPLTSILANAEAGAQLAARAPADIAEIAAILDDIIEDDRRAAGIIVDLRRLMARGETEFEPLDLNQVIEATLVLSRSELLVRQVTVETDLVRRALPIRGNRPQIKQVILNLLMNASEAMADLPREARVVALSTRLREDGWRELAVRDRGPGLAAGVGDPFRPFVSGKPGGLGLGLSICRTIVQAHGGTLAFDAEATGGARVLLALPAP